MSEWDGDVDGVVILSSDAGALQDSGGFQFGEDVLYGAFGDADLSGDFAYDHGGILPEQYEDVGVVGEEGPAGLFGWGLCWEDSDGGAVTGGWGSCCRGHTATRGGAGGGCSGV